MRHTYLDYSWQQWLAVQCGSSGLLCGSSSLFSAAAVASCVVDPLTTPVGVCIMSSLLLYVQYVPPRLYIHTSFG